jgi:predicted ATP-dependent serine protease
LVKEGTYYCPGCGATSAKAGKCTKCNMDMVKMTASTK